MSQQFQKPFISFGKNINVKFDLSNYATKTDLKSVTNVDTSSFVLKTNLTSLKTEVDKLDIDKLVTVLVDLSKLSDVVKNDVVKKALYDKSVAKGDNIDTSEFVLKTKYQTDKAKLEKKNPDVTDFVRKTKLTELENKIPDVSGLATKTALTAVENKIPDVSSLVKKTNYDTKISELEKKLTDHNHDKYITTPEFNTLAADVFNARLAQANLITKTDFDAKLSSLNRKITPNKAKHLLVENKFKKLKAFNSSCFIGKSHFEEDGTQNYSVFQPIYIYFEIIAGVGNCSYINYWKSKGLSDKKINSVKTSNHSINPNFNYYGTKTRVEFNESCLEQDKVTFDHGKIVNIYIVYEISKNINICNYRTLENCLFGAVSLTQKANINKYKYSGYGIRFDRHGNFSFLGIGLVRNVIIFGVDMSFSVHVDNKKKYILILGKVPTQGVEHTLIAEKNVFDQFYRA